MAQYCVNSNAQANGDHEVHNVATCTYLPAAKNRVSLGEHASCTTAVTKAKSLGYYTANGCYWCANPCHTT